MGHFSSKIEILKKSRFLRNTTCKNAKMLFIGKMNQNENFGFVSILDPNEMWTFTENMFL